MSAKRNEWLPVLQAMPGHILEGQDWEEQGVVRSVRRDAEDRWTWFEGEPDPDAEGGAVIREVVSGVALALHLQARQDTDEGLSAADLAATGLPDSGDAYRAFERAVLRALPGILIGEQSQATMVSSWDEYRSIDPGSWTMYRAVPDTVLDPENGCEPESVNDPGNYIEETWDSTGEAASTLTALEEIGFDVDDVIETVAASDPEAAEVLRRARDGSDEDEDEDEDEEAEEAEEAEEPEDEDDTEVTSEEEHGEPRVEPAQAAREEEPYEVDDDLGLHLLGASRTLEILKARKQEQDRLRDAATSSEPATEESKKTV